VPGSEQWELSDGIVTIRPPRRQDTAALVAGREDPETRRWLGESEEEPTPTACIVVGGEVVGWVDFDTDREWLKPREVNVGYAVFAPHRRQGYAAAGLELLLRRLSQLGSYHTARLSIERANTASIALAQRAGFQLAESDERNVDCTQVIPVADSRPRHRRI
jgi:RimJ/RimL family protein N-acetyltransferase